MIPMMKNKSRKQVQTKSVGNPGGEGMFECQKENFPSYSVNVYMKCSILLDHETVTKGQQNLHCIGIVGQSLPVVDPDQSHPGEDGNTLVQEA